MSNAISKTKLQQVTLAMAESMKRDRERRGSQRILTIDEFCSRLGAVRTDLGPNAEQPSVKLYPGQSGA